MLTPRQVRIAELVSQGFTNKQIARELGCSVTIVKWQIWDMTQQHVPHGEGRNSRVRLALWYVTTMQDSDAA